MSAKINCFIPFQDKEQVGETVKNLKSSELVSKIYLLSQDGADAGVEGCQVIATDSLNSTKTIKAIAERADTEYAIIYTKYTTLELGYFALERFVRIAEDSDASMLYADYYQIANGKKSAAPVIDYQFGSLRDDFNFGSLLFFKSKALKCGADRMKQDYKFAGLYDLRLKVSQKGALVHINEYLYSEVELDNRKSGDCEPFGVPLSNRYPCLISDHGNCISSSLQLFFDIRFIIRSTGKTCPVNHFTR